MSVNRIECGRRRHAAVTGIVLSCVLAVASGPARGDTSTRPRKVNSVTVQAFADREAIVPGDSLTLAVSLKTDKGWHVYWRSPGGTGLPTDITWTAPKGFTVGRTRFPVPESKYDKVLKETSYIHEGTAVFLTPVTAPSTLKPAAQARFDVEIAWLACKKNCIPGSARLSLSLPVVAPGDAVKPAHAELFEAARDALPTPAETARHIRLGGSIDRAAATPGEAFNAILNVEIEPKHHMQSHTPLQKGLIPAVLFVAWTDGFDIGEVVYPKAHERTDKVLGKLSEYSGRITFKVPIEVDEDAGTAPRSVSGVFQYQICNDAGLCFPPEHVAFEIPVRMAGGPAPAQQPARAAAAAAGEGATPAGGADGTPPKPGAEQDAASAAEGSAGPAAATAAAPSGGPGLLERVQTWFRQRGYIGVLVMALLGGMLLNLMPCVLPVISLKILSFVKQSNEDRGRILLLGTAYCAGILVFFGVIALLFWQTDRRFGWGQQFQRPVVVLVLAAIVTAFALSLFGVFALFTPKVVCKLGEKAEGEGIPSAFFTGVLATILGTACTAPLLSAAVGAAGMFSAARGAGIFLVVGVGMALPFFLLAANPGWLKFVPRPGPWMGTFEVLMGFLLLGTVVWLLYPLLGQLGEFGMLMTLIFLLTVALAVWIKGRARFGDPLPRRLGFNLLALGVAALGWLVPFRWFTTIDRLVAAQIERTELVAIGERMRNHDCGAARPDVFPWHRQASGGFPWIHYDRAEVIDLVSRGYTVFVDYTANWCVNCKFNLKTSIDIAEVRALMKDYNVIPFEADYTLPVPAIKEDLKRFGRAGVPMYLVYSPGDPDHPQILPEVLTPGIVLDALRKAGPSRVRRPTAAIATPAAPGADKPRVVSQK